MPGFYHPTGAINVALNDVLITGGGVTGIQPRLRVDVGQTSFFAGREFRTFREINLTGGTLIMRAVVNVNTILTGLGILLTDGQARLETVVGGTPGGTFSEVLPIFNRNNMSSVPTPVYTVQNTLTAGGTHTGGTILDVLLVKGPGTQSISVGAEQADERGIAIGTYYFRLTTVGATVGILKARWEERP